MRTSAAVLALGIAACAALVARAQAPPVFPAGAEAVRVDVVVTDRSGRPVRGLRREDFAVREDGVLQEVADFEAVGPAEPLAESAAGPGSPAAVPPPAAVALPASFLIVFDQTHLSAEQARTARGFSADLLQRARPGDRVTLVATHDGRWWTGVAPEGAPDVLRQLDQLQGRLQRDAWPESMSPYEAQRIVQGDRAVERVVVGRMRDRGITPPPGDEAAGSRAYRTDPQVQMLARAVYGDAVAHTRRVLELVGHALEVVPPQRGRTTLVLISGGFMAEPLLGEYRELVLRFVRRGVTAYFYDARDLSMGVSADADTGRLGSPEQERLQMEAVDGEAAGALRLADDTGGFTIRVSDESGLARLEADARHYYLLGYAPTNAKRDGKLRRITVEVRARKAYFAPSSNEPPSTAATRPAAAPDRSAEATARYLALLEGPATARAATLDAALIWPSRDLRSVARTVAADPRTTPARRRAAVLLHTEAALRAEAASARDAFETQRTLAREALEGLPRAGEDADFVRLWFHAMGDHELAEARVAEAVGLFDALLERYPGDAEAHLARGRAHETGLFLLSLVARPRRADQGELTSAGFDTFRYQRSRARSPLVAGTAAYRRAANESFRRALEIEPELVEARLRLGRVLALDGKTDEAVPELRAVADGPSPEARYLAHLFLGRIADERGAMDEATAHARAAVALRPRWQSGRLALAVLLRRAGRAEEASAEAARAVVVPDEPSSEDGWLLYNVAAHDRAEAALEALRGMVRP